MQKEKNDTACRHDNHALARSDPREARKTCEESWNLRVKDPRDTPRERARRPAPLVPSSSLARLTWLVCSLTGLAFGCYVTTQTLVLQSRNARDAHERRRFLPPIVRAVPGASPEVAAVGGAPVRRLPAATTLPLGLRLSWPSDLWSSALKARLRDATASRLALRSRSRKGAHAADGRAVQGPGAAEGAGAAPTPHAAARHHGRPSTAADGERANVGV